MSTGRNDPCPCGSGRKYKHCCHAANEAADARWQAWRRAEGVIDAVLPFAEAEWGPGLFEEALAEFFEGEAPPIADSADVGLWGQLFNPWFAFDFVPAKRRLRKGEAPPPTRPVALEYARRHAERLTPIEARFVAAACAAPLSFMAVMRVQQGRAVDLRDILTGEVHHVLEREGSASLQPGEILLTRVVADGDIAVMSGMGPYPLPPSDHLQILDFRERVLRRGGAADRATVKAAALPIVWLYRHLVERMLNPPPPVLQNTDGDPLAPTTLVFELRCGVRHAFDRLKTLSLERADDVLLSDAAFSEAGELEEVEIVWSKRGNKLHADWDNTTLGQVTISTGEIEVSVNSAKRAKKIRGLIEKHLGPDVLYLRQTVESVDALLEKAREAGPAPGDDANLVDLERTPEGRAVAEEMNLRHWAAWLDTKVPALGKLTPRQAATTPPGRERLEALLAEFTWRQEQSPSNLIKIDVAWIRKELGLEGGGYPPS
jgi:hypothetical protein